MSCHLTLLFGLSDATLKVSSTGENTMIVIQHQSGRVQVNVYGEFTLADYREFEEMIPMRPAGAARSAGAPKTPAPSFSSTAT